jgi:AraC family transcriptional regulator
LYLFQFDILCHCRAPKRRISPKRPAHLVSEEERLVSRNDTAATSPPLSSRRPPEAIGEILDQPPVLAEEVLRGDTRLTQRWSHGALHDFLPAMSGHVIMTYYGASQEITWRQGQQRFASCTAPGTITLIPDGHEGRWDIAGPIEVSHVYLTRERLAASADFLFPGRSIDLVDRVGFEDQTSARVLELLSREAAQGDPATRLFVEQAIDLLCTQLIRTHSSLGTAVAPPPRRGLANWQLKRVTEFMQGNLEREIGLDELAGLVGLSRFHFCTAFRLATGQTPHEWLTALRITAAQQMLAQPELPVTGIALAVGYQTPSAFAAAFRRITGTTPTAYRRRL